MWFSDCVVILQCCIPMEPVSTVESIQASGFGRFEHVDGDVYEGANLRFLRMYTAGFESVKLR